MGKEINNIVESFEKGSDVLGNTIPEKNILEINNLLLEKLKNHAKQLRKDTFEMVYQRKEGHIGGSFSVTDILVVLYDVIMKKEDKFILSKGHSCLPYFLLLKEKGFNPKIAGHPTRDPFNGMDCTTGSLGHGFPIAIGWALGKKLKNEKGDIFVVISDAECQEGTTWESMLLARQHKLDNLIVIIDNNKFQTLDMTDNILSLGNLKTVFEVQGWNAKEVDGHNFKELIITLRQKVKDKPTVVIANTVKGKGVNFMEKSFIEGESKWHTGIPTEEELKIALGELLK